MSCVRVRKEKITITTTTDSKEEGEEEEERNYRKWKIRGEKKVDGFQQLQNTQGDKGAGKTGNGEKCKRSMQLSKSWGEKTQRVCGGTMR